MAGVDTVRGIGYQQAQAVLEALGLFDSDGTAVRVEGVHDVVDVETVTNDGTVLSARQIKIRAGEYTWGKSELLAVLGRWAELPAIDSAAFEFVTDGRLGPTGEAVQQALAASRRGDACPLAELLNVEPDDPVCHRLAGAEIRQDPASTGALLLRAERQVAAMLPSARTTADAERQARTAVDALFRLLTLRAGEVDPERRLVGKAEIAELLGVPISTSPQFLWPGTLRARYLADAASAPLGIVTGPRLADAAVISRAVLQPVGGASSEPLPVSALLGSRAAVLAGRTGTGKSTVCAVARRGAAVEGRVALIAHAEAYLPARLEALTADAMSEVLGFAVPAATGRQVLADTAVTLLIDGVSEVPDAVREALAQDLRAHVASRAGAAVVAVGRDIAATRAVLPTSASPALYNVAALDADHRRDLAHRLLTGEPPDADAEASDTVRTTLLQVDRALGDASGNPMLFSMAVGLLQRGISFTDRTSMYAAFVEMLAERGGAVGISTATRVLGVVYARLLDDERRYADPYEWETLLRDAALNAPARTGEALAVAEAADRAGLITRVGFTQTVVAVHDSFADYLAASAHAAGLAELPTRLRPSDEQRVAFVAESAGLDASLAARVAGELPFIAVRLAGHDRRDLDEGAPSEVAALLAFLLLASAVPSVCLWRHQDRTVAFLCSEQPPRWIPDDEGRLMLSETRSVVCFGGPLAVAVRVWKQALTGLLAQPGRMLPARITTKDDACTMLRPHAEAEASFLASLVEATSPPGSAGRLAAEIGPFGLTARVYERESRRAGEEWPIVYSRSASVDVEPASAAARSDHLTGRSTVERRLRDAPEQAAASRLKETLNRLVGEPWLT